MEATMKLCFEDFGMKRVYLDHYTGNPAAHLYLNLGFQYEGVLRKNCRKNGVLYDVHLMSMLAEEDFERYGK
jgi:RimJ/RimL family protein N-acetyltransferase